MKFCDYNFSRNVFVAKSGKLTLKQCTLFTFEVISCLTFSLLGHAPTCNRCVQNRGKVLYHMLQAKCFCLVNGHLVTDTIPHDHISTLLACRLVALKKKDNGIWLVGAGECLQLIIDKTITGLLKEDTICAVGTLQTCVRLESGSETATYAVRKSYEEEKVNACCWLMHTMHSTNATEKSIWKISKDCVPPCDMPRVLNSYNTPTMQYLENGGHILSQEGSGVRGGLAAARTRRIGGIYCI